MGTVVYRQLDEVEIVRTADEPALRACESAWTDAYRRTPRVNPTSVEAVFRSVSLDPI